jgi:cadmium resistance protein CadD (predicted permease)
MQFDELYKFIGYGFVSLLLLYIIAKSIRFQLGIIEGLVGIKKEASGSSNAPLKDEEDEEEEEEEEEDDDQ